MVEGLVLGHQTTRGVRGMGELGGVHEVTHRGASPAPAPTSSSSSSSSCTRSSSTRGITVGEVKVPVTMETVALGEAEMEGERETERETEREKNTKCHECS